MRSLYVEIPFNSLVWNFKLELMKESADQSSIWYLYLVQTTAGTLYTGISTDPQRRLLEHQSRKRGARSLRGKGKLSLVWQQAVGDRSQALKLEYRLKQQPRERKLKLVQGQWQITSLLQSSEV
jgi:putative endonuclease